MATKKTPAKATGKEVAVVDFEQDAGVGVDDFGATDLAIPFLVILQKGSPQIDEDHPDHEQFSHLEAKTGMIYNSVTQELVTPDEGLDVVPCGYQARYVEWRPRESGGGYVAQHNPDSDAVRRARPNEKNQLVLDNGNILVQTHYYFVIALYEGHRETAVLSMTSTQLKKSRRWNSMMRNLKIEGKNGPFTPPMFSQIYHLSTLSESNDKGSWRGWHIERKGSIEDPGLYNDAKEFHQMVTSGGVQVAPPQQEDTEPTSSGAAY
jgi:hypothetical protein